MSNIGKYWSMGDRWAGIDKNGNRFVVDTKKEAKNKAGSSSSGKQSSSKGGKSMGNKFNVRILTGLGIASNFLMKFRAHSRSPIQQITDGDYRDAMEDAFGNFTGYDVGNGEWNLSEAKGGFATIGGAVGSKLASKSGVNKITPKYFNF